MNSVVAMALVARRRIGGTPVARLLHGEAFDVAA